MYYFTSFIVGFVIMTVELTASRVIAPLLGASLYTWTAVIGVILLAITLGNIIGGILADRTRPRRALIAALMGSGALIAVIPFINAILPSLLRFEYGLLLNLIVAVVMLFFLPAFLLGMVFPLLMKLAAGDIATIGSEAGRISGLGAAGSIAGTFLTGFFFIGVLGNSLTLRLCGALLIGLGIVLVFQSPGLRGKKWSMPLGALLVILFFSPWAQSASWRSGPGDGTIFTDESNYYLISVIDRLGIRWLFLDADLHSAERQNGGGAVASYIKALTLSKVFFEASNQEEPKNILLIGGGSYALAKQFVVMFPSSAVEVVEIDSEVTKTAERYFNLKRYPILTVNEDARWFLQRTDKTYDIIIGDAYNSFISVPWQLTTKEFAELVKKRLSPAGVYLVNFASQTQGSGSAFFKAFSYTLLTVFPEVYGLPLEGIEENDTQNIILIAFAAKPDTIGVSNEILATNLEPETLALGKNLINIARLEFANVKALTDDLAPVEKMMLPTVKEYFPQYVEFLKQNGLR